MTSPADNPLTVSIGSTLELARAIEDFIRRNPSILGGADLYLLDWGSPSRRAGVLAATLVALRDSKGRRAAETLVILSPPGRDREAIKTQAREGFVEALKSLAPNVDLEAAARWFDASARVEIAPDRRSASVVALAKDLPARTVMIVQEAAEYRDDTVAPFIPEGATGALLPADIWAPQLHALAETVAQVIAGSEIHLAFDTHRPIPVRENLLELLKSIEGCGVFGGASEAGVDAILAEHVERWDGWIRDGHLGRALRELDALSVIDDEERSFVRIQLLHRADRRPEALAQVRALLDADRQPSSKDRVRLARICADANSLLLAREVLAPAIDRLESQSDLEVALGVAEDVGDAALQDAAAQRLEALFPASPGLIERQRRQLLSQGQYARLAEAFPQDAAHGAYRLLTEGVAAAGDQAPDYLGLIAAATDANTAEWVRYLGFDDAMRRGLILHAFALVRDEAKLAAFEGFRARKLIRALEAVFLRPVAKGQFAASEADIQTSLVSLIRCLARRPQDAALRILVAELLKPAVAGASGFYLAILALAHIAGSPINLVPRHEPSGGSAQWLAEHRPFVRSLFEWLASESPIVMGRLPAPEALITESADAFVSGAVRCISAAPLDVAEDVEAMHTWIAVGAAVAPYTVDPDYDLVLIRLGATRLASGGFPQAGRDLAEQAMLNCSGSVWRRRLAWFAMADTNQRVRNGLESVLALGCTFACGEEVALPHAFYEIELLARLFRDAGLIDWALDAVGKARDVLSQMEMTESEGQRLDTLELSIRQRMAAALPATDPAFDALIRRAIEVGRTVLEIGEQAGPMASMLAGALRRARRESVVFPLEAGEVLEALIAKTSGALRALLEAITADAPSAAQLLAATNAGDRTRYSDDAGYDASIPALLAERSLVSADFCADPVQVSLALELLTDRAVAIPGWDEAAEPPPPIQAIDVPADMARALSRNGCAIVQAGWSESGQLVHLSTVAGELRTTVPEPQGRMSQADFQMWAKEYPYRYGVDELAMNLFHTSTEALKWSQLPEGPLVFACDAGLQAYPPNIIRIDDTFIGRERAVAATPSLSWLTSALASGRVGDGRRCAWISAAEKEGQTFTFLIQRFEGLFEDYGIALNTDERLPSDMAGASMAIVTAHGGVHPDGQYFQVVTDEGELRVSADDMANALRNIDLVVLFVCSAGRADKHPTATTALGLAKRIVDRGCSTVIASPWPLDSQVAPNWLEAFLRHWEAGETAMEANFLANRAVDARFAADNARGLAMTVYGNPFLMNA